MKRTLLFALALVACGDDSPSADERPAEQTKDASQATKDASPRGDAAPDLLDAAMEDGSTEADARGPEPDATLAVDASSFDAQTRDATVDAAASDDASSMCAAEGERCDGNACCDGTACVTTSAHPYKACAKTCAEDSECESGCCANLDGAKACALAAYCEAEPDPTAPLAGTSCYMNLNVYDHSGEYMGKATSYYSENESVCKTFAPYGKNGSGKPNMWAFDSDAYDTQIFFSATLGCGSNFPVIAYVSKFKGTSDKRVVDPDNLCKVLENSHL